MKTKVQVITYPDAIEYKLKNRRIVFFKKEKYTIMLIKSLCKIPKNKIKSFENVNTTIFKSKKSKYCIKETCILLDKDIIGCIHNLITTINSNDIQDSDIINILDYNVE